MFWMFMALLVIAGALLLRRRGNPAEADEPWRASLRDEEDETPLDLDEIRRAEEEWLAEEAWPDEEDGWQESAEDEGWR